MQGDRDENGPDGKKGPKREKDRVTNVDDPPSAPEGRQKRTPKGATFRAPMLVARFSAHPEEEKTYGKGRKTTPRTTTNRSPTAVDERKSNSPQRSLPRTSVVVPFRWIPHREVIHLRFPFPVRQARHCHPSDKAAFHSSPRREKDESDGKRRKTNDGCRE